MQDVQLSRCQSGCNPLILRHMLLTSCSEQIPLSLSKFFLCRLQPPPRRLRLCPPPQPPHQHHVAAALHSRAQDQPTQQALYPQPPMEG